MKLNKSLSLNSSSKPKKVIAFSEILTFLLSSFAFAFILGGMMMFSVESVESVEDLILSLDEPIDIYDLRTQDFVGTFYPDLDILRLGDEISSETGFYYDSTKGQLYNSEREVIGGTLEQVFIFKRESILVPATPTPAQTAPPLNNELDKGTIHNSEENSDDSPPPAHPTRWQFAGKHLKEGWFAAGAVLTFTQLIAQFIPEEDTQNLVKSAGLALAAGIALGKTTYAAWGWARGGKAGWIGKTTSVLAGAALAYWLLASQYEETDEHSESIEFKCMSWQAPLGGSDCDVCNSDPLKPCSEYRCKSLGQTCKLINQGTGKELCIDSGRDDVTSPGIKPWPEVITAGYAYTDVKPRPPGGNGPAGMRITSEGGCLKAFTPFEFGIITTDTGDELQPAQCKIDFKHTSKFDDMQYWMGDVNTFEEKHSQVFSLPGTDLLNRLYSNSENENQTPLAIENDGEYSLYIRCRDGNGNENRDEFSVGFCIEKSPDVVAPIIKATNPISGSPVLYQVDNVSVSFYTNEPASCSWSRRDASYSNMENTMSCNNNVWEMNAEFLYTCNTVLTGIKDKETNLFYIRCKDLTNNEMSQSYEYTLMGTQPLTILSVEPNGTIGSSTSTATVTLKVKTDNGYSKGESTCYYSPTNNENDYVAMVNTNTNVHTQPLDLVGGSYTYYFKCVDAGGNTAYDSTSFNVFVDKYSPVVVRAYNWESKLIIFTDEESNCKYSTESCNFDPSLEGVSMPYELDIVHYAEWKINQYYYIKCLDEYQNQPSPSECSMILRPFELESEGF